GLAGVAVDLFDDVGGLLSTAFTDPTGSYAFADLPGGEYTVAVNPPIGFSGVTTAEVVTIVEPLHEVDFALVPGETTGPRHIWWWKTYLDDVRSDGPRRDKFTVEDVNTWGQTIYDHYCSRQDDNAICLENVTYSAATGAGLSFEDICWMLLDFHDSDIPSRIRRGLLTNLLNIASGRLGQWEIVSQDGATASQAIRYFADIYRSGNEELYLTAYFNLRRMHMGDMIPVGVVPLSTPNIMYKAGDEFSDQRGLPTRFDLHQNYPNPFNPSTEISFSVPEACDVTLEVYNVLGRRVISLIDGRMDAGTHTVTWDATELSSGIYLYRLQAGEYRESRKMMLLK
ncbi:T9SS type A sorting domain-containing protein, partial [candidate division GN15 bacterium]|nr:T9SS type A sorting domain-containing protein [candidate division GN15 bacterium]